MVRRQDKKVDFSISEQLLNCLVRGRCFYQLVLLVRSNILRDSKQLACFLLSQRNRYHPAAQLGLDMLDRLDCLSDLMESLSLSSLTQPSLLGNANTRPVPSSQQGPRSDTTTSPLGETR